MKYYSVFYKNIRKGKRYIYPICLMPYIDDTLMSNIEFLVRYLPQYSVEYYLLDSFLRLYLCESNRKYIEKILKLFAKKNVFFYDYDGKVTALLKKISASSPQVAIELCNLYIKGGCTKYLQLLNEFKCGEDI